MEKARQAVSNFVSRDGKHHTTIDEDVRAAVTEEHVKPHRHENVTRAVDKEVHQDHHHTTVQPVMAKETLPEKHTHNMVPVEHRSFEHEDASKLRDTLDRDAAKYKSTSTTHDTTHSASTIPAVESEHVHHHVHEHVQPVIQKEVSAPEVVHTTIPVHEKHHASAIHHGTSTLPPKTVDEFRAAGGELSGRQSTLLNEYEGCPTAYKKELQSEQLIGDKTLHPHGHSHSHSAGQTAGVAGTAGALGAGLAHKKKQHRKDGGSSSSSSSDNEDVGRGKKSNYSIGAMGAGAGAGAMGKHSARDDTYAQPRTDPTLNTHSTRSSGTTTEGTERKESLVDKIASKVKGT